MNRNEIQSRNAPCWCGSGLKFKKCHLSREKERPLHQNEIQRLIRGGFAQKRCLHPEAASGICTKIIDAHTIQRARTLEALIDSSEHVLSFNLSNANSKGLNNLQRVGWRRASTFTGFCGKHDSETFSPVENSPFKFTPETAFLLTYRALCHELFQKMGSELACIKLRPFVDRGEPPERQKQLQNRCEHVLAGVRSAIADLLVIKQIADKELLAKNYADWEFACLTFSGPLCFATSGSITPNQDLKGTHLQTLHDPNSQLEHLYVSVVADQQSPRVILGWRQRHCAPRKLVKSLLTTPGSLMSAYFVQYVFAHLENVYFSADWWGSLSPHDQNQIQELASNSNAYYYPPHYADTPTVPWLLSSIELFNETV